MTDDRFVNYDIIILKQKGLNCFSPINQIILQKFNEKENYI